jgi:hypothetical protein
MVIEPPKLCATSGKDFLMMRLNLDLGVQPDVERVKYLDGPF